MNWILILQEGLSSDKSKCVSESIDLLMMLGRGKVAQGKMDIK